MIDDVIYSLLVLNEKLAFFNKRLQGFIVYLNTLLNIFFTVLESAVQYVGPS